MRPSKKLLIAIISIFLISSVPVSAHADSTTIQQNKDTLSQIVVFPTGNYDENEANAMVNRLANIDGKYLNALNQNNLKIKLLSGMLTDEKEYAYLKGVVPKGWEGTGKTWDDVPGLGGSTVALRIGFSNKGKGHDAINLELHETAHAIDHIVLNDISKSAQFKQIFAKEGRSLGNVNYLGVYPEEFFAEAFAYYYLNQDTNSKLKSACPQTYSFLQNLAK
ncbi:zinc metalloprotease Zmp1 [Clostridioides difficile]|uniref:zinc metalloprotease Zmp1 n=2 Tax=Clostridioides difficile TaxID=1496 RepID=UPI00038D02A2|nr:zinc metalloprotease Zmp1 [Clostridioides difficile]EKS6796899.1 zinc metalloprotease Zmp1 [Clostridioides difficile]ELX4547839.1 zinc metalloprotease Zmp1 [Clostridioides difficile]EQG55931.1 anthrax toxin lethal factor, N- and C-terminal domain protein [Clostridioides difficile DA00145]MBF9983644.1 zinc metalloprotease Zmp1 [Clostridioides difficile]MBH6969714.1 zinc metalloprotease Zmp1 [Clostridioides difficile]